MPIVRRSSTRALDADGSGRLALVGLLIVAALMAAAIAVIARA